MELFGFTDISHRALLYLGAAILFVVIVKVMQVLVRWGKGMPKGAYLFLAIFPLISIFPIPPTLFKNLDKAKQEQRKNKQESGEPPDNQL